MGRQQIRGGRLLGWIFCACEVGSNLKAQQTTQKTFFKVLEPLLSDKKGQSSGLFITLLKLHPIFHVEILKLFHANGRDPNKDESKKTPMGVEAYSN